jgi:SHS2 domain-containing protein
MSGPDDRGYRFVDHTAELALRLRAGTLDGLFAEAVTAIGAELTRECGVAGVAPSRELVLAAGDPEALLVDLLNELVFVAETERWVPGPNGAVAVGVGRLTAHLPGLRLRATPARIKGATFHGLTIRGSDTGYEAEVVFDV